MQIEVLAFEDAVAGGADPGLGDHIMGIALSDSTGWEELLIVDPKNVEESERAALKRLTAIIKERDPDVIEGHDLFRFHLPYLVARAKNTKTKLDWGRGDGFLRSRPSRLQIAEKTLDYPKFTVGGRHFVDTFLLAHLTMLDVLLLVSSGPMWPGILIFAAVTKFPRLRAGNYSVCNSTIRNNFGVEHSAVFARHGHYLNC